MKITEALEILTTTYQSLDAVAMGLEVDAKEVADALAKANPDSAEYIALQVLAKYNPYTANKTKENKNDSTNQVE
jgi:hypothetical protein